MTETVSDADHGAALEHLIQQGVEVIERLQQSFGVFQSVVHADENSLQTVQAAAAAATTPEVAAVYARGVEIAEKNLATDVESGTAVEEKIRDGQKRVTASLKELKTVAPESSLASLAEAA